MMWLQIHATNLKIRWPKKEMEGSGAAQWVRVVTGERMGVNGILRVVWSPLSLYKSGLREWRGKAQSVTERVEETHKPKRTRKRGVRTIITTHTLVIPATNRNLAFLKTKKKINETRCLGDQEASQKSTGTEGKVPFLVWELLTQTWPHRHLPLSSSGFSLGRGGGKGFSGR